MASLLLALPMLDVEPGQYSDFSQSNLAAAPVGVSPVMDRNLAFARGRGLFFSRRSSGEFGFLRFEDGVSFGGAFTVEARVVPGRLPDDVSPGTSDDRFSLFGSSSGTTSGETDLRYGDDGIFEFRRQSNAASGPGIVLRASTVADPGERHHVAVQFTGTSWSLYVNGQLEAEVSDSTGWGAQLYGFDVGCGRNDNYQTFQASWEGWIEEFLVWDAAVYSGTEITPGQYLIPGITGDAVQAGVSVSCILEANMGGKRYRCHSASDGSFSFPWPAWGPTSVPILAERLEALIFAPGMAVSAGDIVSPTTDLGRVVAVQSDGVMPETEPTSWPQVGDPADLNGVSVVGIAASTQSRVATVPVGSTGVELDVVSDGGGGIIGDPVEVSGTVSVRDSSGDLSPVERRVVAIDMGSGSPRVIGSAFSDQGGDYTIAGHMGSSGKCYLMALDLFGQQFSGGAQVVEGQLIHPSLPNGYVYQVFSGGTLPATEPDWWTTGQQQVGTATLEAREYLRPLAHGPVDVTFL